MKKKAVIFTILMIGLVFYSSCDTNLDLDNPNQVNRDAYWKNLDDLEAGLATVYNVFVDNNNAGYWEVQALQVKENRTENFEARNDVPDRYAISTFKNDIGTNLSADIYKALYIGIFRANQVINYSKNITNADETKKKQIVAEALFLRGLNYFNLVVEYGSVPIITEVPQNTEDYFKPKSTEEEVWKQTIADFEAAANDLPESYSTQQKGRVTKYAAIAFLGKSYLYLKNWSKAEEQFAKLVDNETSIGFGLLDNYADLFDGKNENSKESVFEIQFAKVGGGTIWGGTPPERSRTTTIAQECAPGAVGGWFEMFPTKTLLNSLTAEKTLAGDFDPRALATIAWNYPGCIYYKEAFEKKFGKDAIWLRKNQNWWNANEGEWRSELNEYVMRYADVLLMHAEAKTMQGKVSEAAPLVKRIRDRAKLTDISMTAWTQDQMMSEIMKQRNIEFAREGIHFYDLRRWGTLETVIKASQENGYELFQPKFSYYPIPQRELNNNPKMTQNAPW